MKLLSVITSLNPACGGPVECAVQLQRNLTKLGHVFDIVTLDPPDATWIHNCVPRPICLGKKNHRSRNIEPALIDFLHSCQREYDGSVFHGIWTFPNVAIRACWNKRHRYVVFPHGMLDPYFIKYFPFKHIKKSLYYRLIAAPVLERAHAVLFTCDEERRLASASYRPIAGKRIVVRYGINPPSFSKKPRENPFEWIKSQTDCDQLVLFIGRIHPKKGCDLLIEALARITPAFPSVRVAFAGPDEREWVPVLQKLAQVRGVADRIIWLGPVYGNDKWFLYNVADVSILPSHMENFGMTVAESLSQGLPVLLSDRVNIFPSIVRAGAGFAAPDTIDGTTSLLRSWLNTSQQQRSLMRVNCLRLFQDEFQAIHTAEDVVRVFQQDLVTGN